MIIVMALEEGAVAEPRVVERIPGNTSFFAQALANELRRHVPNDGVNDLQCVKGGDIIITVVCYCGSFDTLIALVRDVVATWRSKGIS